MSKLKNIKIDESVHKKLKSYCESKGLKVGKFVENLINSRLPENKQ